ncbi:hypothetical protein AAFF_G00069890 [Aldrovandia affinis]|uniref:Uncharacterized protein n=1 Tax=Aldrovandia affinis TaxID=143900 RepID=A0AAD7R1S0_9TELE|nr:hypothetical protein AAFF_G00069890 [Aldrovandia affinis]
MIERATKLSNMRCGSEIAHRSPTRPALSGNKHVVANIPGEACTPTELFTDDKCWHQMPAVDHNRLLIILRFWISGDSRPRCGVLGNGVATICCGSVLVKYSVAFGLPIMEIRIVGS